MARPLLEYLDTLSPDAAPGRVFAHGLRLRGATLSSHAKATISRLLPQVIVIDGYGSDETGITGSQGWGQRGGGGGAGGFRVDATTAVPDDELRPLAPGSANRPGGSPAAAGADRMPPRRRRKLLRPSLRGTGSAGRCPVTSRRWRAMEPSRSSGVAPRRINTGGEKVFAEEVESVLTASPKVCDAVVVGAPDARWGERVVAVVAPRPGSAPTLASCGDHCRPYLAGYKLPKELRIVDAVVRAPSGKPDYRWARSLVDGGAPETIAGEP